MTLCMRLSACQELNNADKKEEARVPRTLEVELTEDLVDSCTAGDVVTVLGLVKVLSTDTRPGALHDMTSDPEGLLGC